MRIKGIDRRQKRFTEISSSAGLTVSPVFDLKEAYSKRT